MLGIPTAATDWKESNALLIETVADLLSKMSDESHGMQATIGRTVETETDALSALMKLQKLDFHTQKQADLAAVLRVLATCVRHGEFDPETLEKAANLQELRDVIAQRPKRTSKRRFSIGRLDWFD